MPGSFAWKHGPRNPGNIGLLGFRGGLGAPELEFLARSRVSFGVLWGGLEALGLEGVWGFFGFGGLGCGVYRVLNRCPYIRFVKVFWLTLASLLVGLWLSKQPTGVHGCRCKSSDRCWGSPLQLRRASSHLHPVALNASRP